MNSRPSSTSIISATEMIGLVMEKMRKMALLGSAGPPGRKVPTSRR